VVSDVVTVCCELSVFLSCNRRNAEVSVQFVVMKIASSWQLLLGDDLDFGPSPSKEIASSPAVPFARQTSLPSGSITSAKKSRPEKIVSIPT
jgi:hypothetical protein